MKRKLASIRRVSALEPIVEADLIQAAVVGGWRVVVNKIEFEVGDLGVFLEIDSIPPDHDLFRFLWDRRGEGLARPDNYRLKTAKLRGVVSQGLLLPLTAVIEAGLLPPRRTVSDDPGASECVDWEDGDDVTAQLGVEKWEPPASISADTRGLFLPFISKTDEIRVQAPEGQGALAELLGIPYVITLKLDGTSATFAIDPRDGEFHAMGRNWSIRDGDNAYWNMARKYDMEGALRTAGNEHFALQGEIVGPGIQKNRLGLRQTDLYIFNVYDMQRREYLTHAEARTFVEEARTHGGMGMRFVPVLEEGEAFSYIQEELLAKAEGHYPNTTNEREGIVIRARHNVRSASLDGSRLSIKVASNRFLLKGGD